MGLRWRTETGEGEGNLHLGMNSMKAVNGLLSLISKSLLVYTG